jgi:hypothetical protein
MSAAKVVMQAKKKYKMGKYLDLQAYSSAAFE